MKKLQFSSALLIVALAGCSSGSGGDFRAEELPSKAEIQKQIDDVNANPNLAAGAKSTIIAGLNRKKERAK